MRTLFAVGLVSLAALSIGAGCTHAEAPAVDPPSSVEVGRLVKQGHAPLGAPAHASMVTLELELSTGAKLISQPKVMTLPNTDAIVRQGFRMGQGDATEDATLALTLRPVTTQGKRCTVQASSRVSTAGAHAATTKKQVRVPMGKWVDVVDAAPIQVRMRCTQSQPRPTLARAR